MSPTRYVDIRDLNDLQEKVMLFIQNWIIENRVPIPLKVILAGLGDVGVKSYTAVNVLNSLLRKGYIRRAYTISNKTFYVQVRKL